MWKCTPNRAAAVSFIAIAALSAAGTLRAAAAACDLTDQWRSTIGVIDLVYAPYEAAMSAQGLVRPTLEAEGPPTEAVTADGAVEGTFRTELGLGRLDGVVDGRRIDVK